MGEACLFHDDCRDQIKDHEKRIGEVQLGAFYNKGNCDAKAAELKAMVLDTYKVKG